jgi:hypothetical protein
MSYGGDTADDTALRPAHGGRILLNLVDAGGTAVRYAVALATPTAVARGVATVDLHTGAVALEAHGAPPWLVEQARRFVTVLARDHRAPGAPAWPRRLLRWRPEPADGTGPGP